MSRKAESILVNKIRAMLAARGIPSLKMHGSVFTVTGVADLLFCLNGRMCWLEVKVPGEEPTKVQARFLEQWRQCGCLATWVDSVEGAEAFVDLWLAGFETGG